MSDWFSRDDKARWRVDLHQLPRGISLVIGAIVVAAVVSVAGKTEPNPVIPKWLFDIVRVGGFIFLSLFLFLLIRWIYARYRRIAPLDDNHMTQENGPEWWYDDAWFHVSAQSELYLAQLIRREDGSAEIIFAPTERKQFSRSDDALIWLGDEEFRQLEDLVQDYVEQKRILPDQIRSLSDSPPHAGDDFRNPVTIKPRQDQKPDDNA